MEFLLVSANIGSIFDFPDKLFPIWINSFMKIVDEMRPIFIAIHFQEVGGKNYEESMKYVDRFMKLILKNDHLKNYDKARIYLDDDVTYEEKFTALGNLYFIHESIEDVSLWDFEDHQFRQVSGREIFSANIEDITHKYKEKFPLDFYPDGKWSRKGFMQTRWKIQNQIFDFVNIHLFHDVCNMTPILKNAQVYSSSRKKGLEYTVKKITENFNTNHPLFIFGDYNFRLNTARIVNELVLPHSQFEIIYKKSASSKSSMNPDEISKLIYKITNEEINATKKPSQNLLEIGRKYFDLVTWKFGSFFNNSDKFRTFDEEHSRLDVVLFEFPITFPPSYPFNEEDNKPNEYMKTRCPSWCDRIMMNECASKLLQTTQYKYAMVGLDASMGDHKPIRLSFQLPDYQLDNSVATINNGNNNDDNSNNNSCTITNQSRLTKSRQQKPIKSMKPRYSIVDSINGNLVEEVKIKSTNWNVFDHGKFQGNATAGGGTGTGAGSGDMVVGARRISESSTESDDNKIIRKPSSLESNHGYKSKSALFRNCTCLSKHNMVTKQRCVLL